MTKLLALVLFPLGALALAVWAQPAADSESSPSNPLARVEAADREFLATLEPPASTQLLPPPAAAPAPAFAVTPPTIVAPPKAIAAGPAPIAFQRAEPISQPQASKPTTSLRKATVRKSPPKKEPTVRRAIPVVRDYTVRTESPGRVVLKHYQFPKDGGRTVKVTTTVITRGDGDEDDD